MVRQRDVLSNPYAIHVSVSLVPSHQEAVQFIPLFGHIMEPSTSVAHLVEGVDMLEVIRLTPVEKVFSRFSRLCLEAETTTHAAPFALSSYVHVEVASNDENRVL